MRPRLHAALTVLAVAGVAAGGRYLEREVGPRPPQPNRPGTAVSGAWLCPHGGGPGEWSAAVTVANPGPEPATVRVRTLGAGLDGASRLVSVPGRSQVVLPVRADRRDRSTIVEYFGAWVAAGWSAVVSGEESGATAEPCRPEAGRSWLLPDATTEEGQEAYLVVMNPFATDAVFSLVLVTEGRRIRFKDWTDFVLHPGRSVAFHLNANALGDRTVATEIEVSIGRVAAASLGVVRTGGVRSTVGVPGGPRREVIAPGGGDEGHAALAVFNPGPDGVAFEVSVHGTAPGEVGEGLVEEVLPPTTAATYPLTALDPGYLGLAVRSESGVAAARRSILDTDQGATPGSAAPGPAWVLLAAHSGSGAPLEATLYLANPGQDPVRVSLTPLPSEGGAARPVRTVEIPPGSVVAVAGSEGGESFLALAEEGAFVPVVVSRKPLVGGYGLALGVPIPGRRIPA